MNLFPESFHNFPVRYISSILLRSKYFRPEQFSAPGSGVCDVWELARSQNVVGPLLAAAPALLLSPWSWSAPVSSPGRHSSRVTTFLSSLTSETSNSEQFTANTLPSALLKLLQNSCWSHNRQTYILSISGKTNGFSPGPRVCLWSAGNCISRSTAGLPTSDD